MRETTPGEPREKSAHRPPLFLLSPTLPPPLPVPLVHETRRFDGSTSPHDVEPFFSCDSRTREARARVLPKLVEPGREERTTRVETTRPQPPWFRHDQLLRRRSAQPTSPPRSWLSQHVSASERLSRNHPAVEKQTRPQVTMVSTRPARRASRSAQPTSFTHKPVEPDCDEGAARVETTRYFLVSPPPVSGSDR